MQLLILFSLLGADFHDLDSSEGKRLCNLIRAAQETLVTNTQTGRFSFQGKMETSRGDKFIASGIFSFQRGKRRWDYTSNTESAMGESYFQKQRTYIEDGNRTLRYEKHLERSTLAPKGKYGENPLIALDPDRLWFSTGATEIDSGRKWVEFLDKDVFPQAEIPFEIGQEEELVTLRYTFEDGDRKRGVVSINFDLDMDGHVTSSTVNFPGTDSEESGAKYTWIRSADQRVWLEKFHLIENMGNPLKMGSKPLWVIEYTFKDFESTPDFTENHFSVSGLSLPKGTKVSEWTGPSRTPAKVFYVGGVKPNENTQLLQRLVEEIQSSGFAKPE